MGTTRAAAPLLVVLATLAGIAGLAGSPARGSGKVAPCESVRVSGGDYNGAGGTIYAEIRVANTGRQPCSISGRPWVRVTRLDHPVTIADLRGDALAGRPGATIVLAHGRRARAFILIRPGRCDRTNGTTFTLWAHAGWGSKGATIVGTACDDGSAEIDVGSFQH
ncbi:MAG TPA: DUF4232 domain-containing protein [Gaiellaceae bacterium]|nr:DUF4232 domain-containing protein [Gaiellaceae bacterium]